MIVHLIEKGNKNSLFGRFLVRETRNLSSQPKNLYENLYNSFILLIII